MGLFAEPADMLPPPGDKNPKALAALQRPARYSGHQSARPCRGRWLGAVRGGQLYYMKGSH